MATLAHSYTTERQAPHRPRSRTADEIAIERWGGRQLRIAQSVAAFLDEVHEGEWRWEASDNFFGTPVDSAVITGKTPNGDGTHSGVIIIGDMDHWAPMLRAMGVDIQRPRSFADAFLERVHWLDPFWGPLPLPYHLTQWIEENEMALSNQDKKDIKAMIAEGVAEALKDYSMPSTRISFSLSQKIAFASFLLASVAAIGGAIIGGSIYVHKSIADSRVEMANVRGEVRSLGVLIGERLPAKQSTTAATSPDTRSSTPPTATDDPVEP